MSAPSSDTAGAVLTIDLTAIVDNWRQLQARVGSAECAAVVKADAYGLGAAQVAPALAAAGCRQFFVAHLDEAIVLKPLLPAAAAVSVLHGPTPGSEAEFVARGVRPVLNSRPQIDAWRRLAQRLDRELDAIVQVDTGMARLGLDAAELQGLASDLQSLAGIHVKSRQVPMHPSTIEALRRYRWTRDLAGESVAPEAAFFIGTRGRRHGLPLGDRQVHRVFVALREQLGWRNRGNHHAPRIHDLRHTFIVRRIAQWQAQGVDVDQAMLSLSTYVGHAEVGNTYWYLSAAPELMAVAARRFASFVAQTEVSDA